jgi:general secretion pathway protein C
LRDTESRFIGIFGVGDRLRGATIVAVGETRVHLSQEGRPRYLDLLAPSDPPAPAAAPSAPGIRKLDEHSYEVERTTLEALLANTPALLQGARIAPELREGHAAGFRFYSVRPDSAFARIGLRNGDVVVAINGLPLTTPEGGLEAFVKLRSASHVSLAIERRGERITHDYRIR